MKQKLTLQGLTGLDNGKAAAVFQHELRKVVKDCVDRPGESGARKVYLEVSVKPSQDAAGICETAEVEFEVKSKIPTQRTKTYQMEVDARGELLFNEASPDDIKQRTLDEANDD